MKLKKGDHVIVLSGKYRGERADVLTVLPTRNSVILDSLNIAKRHSKNTGRTKAGSSVMQGGIIDKYMPIDASAVALWCSKHNGPSRAGYRDDKGKKVRFCRQCGEQL
jgi:large subunit ribosomal protein L24